MLLYKDSSDTRVSSAGIEVKTGRKRGAKEAVQQAEARLRHGILVGLVAVGRAGLGSHTTPRYDKAQGREKQQLIQGEICAEVEEERRSKTVAMHQQEVWTKWDHASTRKITWSELWKSEPARLKFLIQSVYDVLPSPSNLHCWGLAETPACPLCSCSKALGEGRYRLLKAVADVISAGIQPGTPRKAEHHFYQSIRAEPAPDT